MNIVACVKRVPNTEAEAKLASDGQGLDSSSYQYMVSFYDEIAVEQAVQTKEALGGEVTVLSLGSKGGTKEIRECMAKGADKAVVMVDENWQDRDCRATAKILSAKISEQGADLVYMGKVATDRDNGAVGPMVATYLGWACVTDVIELEMTATGGTAKRETEAGIETVEFDLPAIVTCNKGLNEPRYAGLKGIMAAKKKPLEEVDAQGVDNQAQVVKVSLPEARKEGRMVDGVDALIEALQNEANVL
ncbi:MAG: electron transfer flavoprotein subunit beta/FixA family protein [bacterium]|nr:electron transfer flavoprotein subunit beta/FixA family protein [bacterium]